MLWLKKNDRVRLSQAVGPIPAGCYKFSGRSDGYLVFQVGKKIIFGVSNFSDDILKKQPLTARLNTPEEFVVEYSLRLEKQKDLPFDPKGPFTFCNILSGVSYEKNSHETAPHEEGEPEALH